MRWRKEDLNHVTQPACEEGAADSTSGVQYTLLVDLTSGVTICSSKSLTYQSSINVVDASSRVVLASIVCCTVTLIDFYGV